MLLWLVSGISMIFVNPFFIEGLPVWISPCILIAFLLFSLILNDLDRASEYLPYPIWYWLRWPYV
jgi:hypothetical protein